jgi:diguanylate cyclase (GGDEF)-like protein/PAS domain S-box-containing protein
MTVVAVVAAFWLHKGLEAQLGIRVPPFLTFYPAILCVALFFGLWQGLLATALAAFLVDFWILPPIGHLRIANYSDAFVLCLFSGICVFVCILSDRYRKYQRLIASVEGEKTLLATKGKLEAAMASMTDAMFISDTAGRFIDFNEAFATFHKFRNKTECAKTLAEYQAFLELLQPNGKPAPLNMWAVARALRGESGANVEYTLRRKDTGESWIGSYNFSPVRDGDGAVVGAVVTARDVTSQRDAENALRASEERYRTVFHSGTNAVALMRASDTTYIDVNEAFLSMTGYERSEVIGKKGDELQLWADPVLRNAELDRLKQLNSVQELTAQFRRKNGELIWGVLTASFTEIDGERCILAVIRDITDTMRAEQALRASEARYRAAFEISQDGIIISRLDNDELIDANQAYVKMSGWAREEAIGRTAAELDVWEDERMHEKAVETCGRDGVLRDFKARFRRKDGSTYWGVISGAPVEIGGVQCFHSVLRDISKSVRDEEALQASESRYRTAFELSEDAIALTRLRDAINIDVNQSFVEMSGYRRDEIIGRSSAELKLFAHPEDLHRFAELLKSEPTFRDAEVELLTKNGQTLWGILSASLVEIDGEPFALSFMRNITALKQAQDSLRASEVRYRTAFQTSLDAISITRLVGGTYLDVNSALCTILGYERQELIGHAPSELGIWADLNDRDKLVSMISKGGICKEMQAQFHRKSGEIFWGIVSASSIEIDGSPCILSVFRDVTNLRSTQDALKASEVRYRTAFQTSLDAITIIRLSDARIMDVNQKFLEITGYDRLEVLGITSEELGFWKERREREDVIDLLRRGSSYRDLQAQFLRKNGEVFWGVISASPMELEGETCALSVIQDISGAKHAEEEIRTLAFFDPLTGLANRRMLMEQLRKSIVFSTRSHRKRALLIADLDDFKTLNDTLGHETGDLLLREVGQRISSCVRASDTVGRLGGDEFVLLLEDMGETLEEAAAQAKIIAEKVLAQVDIPYQLDGHECRSTCSIGITVFGDSREKTNEVLQQADIAMYQAKAAGRNSLRFFAPELQAAVNTRASMEEDLRQGIKGNQFMLYFQPQVEDGSLIGAEALLRWQHPRLGVLLPGEFILLAEQSRLILPLGNWVLDAACRQIAAWADDSRTADIVLAVNISALQLRQTNFVDEVFGALERNGANPRNLKLELTESMLVDNVEDVIAKMTLLRTHGLRFSVDDFGTGYSSLTYLKRLPLDQLKIDRSFVRDLLVDLSSAAIAQTIISLGQIMGLSVIAEGVETQEQLDLLAKLGCHSYQGFLFSPPVPLEAFERFLPGFTGLHDLASH